MNNYFITYHSVDRLKERFPAFSSKIPELKNWKREDGLSNLKLLFDKMLSKSIEDKSHLNNTQYMVNLYDKYGYNKEYKFMNFQESDIVFILAKDRSEKSYRIVTLMPSSFKKVVKHTKYGNTNKEDKLNLFINEWNGVKKNVIVDKTEKQNNYVDDTAIKNELILEKNKGNVKLLGQITQTISSNRTIINNVEYDFYVSTTDNMVEIKNRRELSEIEINDIENEKNLKKLTGQLKSLFLSNRITKLDLINNDNVYVCNAQVEDVVYNFEYHLNTTRVSIIDSKKLEGKLLFDYNLQKENTYDFRQTLIKNIEKNKYSLIEQLSESEILITSNVKEFKYEFVYNKDSKLINLKNKINLDGEELEFFLLQKELDNPMLDSIKKLIHYNKVDFIKKISEDISLNKFKLKNSEYEFTYNKKNSDIELMKKYRV